MQSLSLAKSWNQPYTITYQSVDHQMIVYRRYHPDDYRGLYEDLAELGMMDLPQGQQDILWRHIDRITAQGDSASLDAAVKAVQETLCYLGVQDE